MKMDYLDVLDGLRVVMMTFIKYFNKLELRQFSEKI